MTAPSSIDSEDGGGGTGPVCLNYRAQRVLQHLILAPLAACGRDGYIAPVPEDQMFWHRLFALRRQEFNV